MQQKRTFGIKVLFLVLFIKKDVEYNTKSTKINKPSGKLKSSYNEKWIYLVLFEITKLLSGLILP